MWTSHRNFLQNHPTPRPLFSLASGDVARPGIQGGSPGAPARLPLSRADGPPTGGGQPHSQTPTPHTGGGDRAMRRPADALPHPDAAGLAAPCPLSTESAGEPAPPGMAFTSQGTAQRRKATAQGGAWGRGRPNEPLKAEICTGWRLFSAAGSNIGDANCSQICFKQRDRTDLKAPWSPRQWVGGFSGEGLRGVPSYTPALPASVPRRQRGPGVFAFFPALPCREPCSG